MDVHSAQKSESLGKRSLAILLLALALSLIAYQYYASDFTLRNSAEPPPPDASPSPVLNVPTNQLRAALANAYRLKPDRRFLLAVAQVPYILSKPGEQQASATFENGKWQITYGGMPVGTLPEFPDFPQMIEVLTHWASSQARLHHLELTSDSSEQRDPAVEALLVQFHAPYVAQAARLLDQRWNSGDRRSSHLRSALRALVLLNLQSLDRMEISDLLPARALALLALTKGLTSHPAAREEALLADLLSYDGHAARLALTLPAADPVHHYVARQDRELRALAENDAASVETRYLWLLRLADRKDSEAVYNWTFKHFSAIISPSVRKPSLMLNKFGPNSMFSSELASDVLRALAQDPSRPHFWKIAGNMTRGTISMEEVKALIRNTPHLLSSAYRTQLAKLTNRPYAVTEFFEDELKALEQYYTGPFLDSTTYQTYYRGHFYSGLYVLGLHVLDSRADVQGAEQLSSDLGENPSGTAGDFQRWYHHIVQSEAGKRDPGQLLQDLSSLKQFGIPPLMRTYEEQKKSFPYGGLEMPRSIRLLVSRMDTRPSHRISFADTAWSSLHDVGLAEKLFVSALEAGPHANPSLQAWFAGFSGDKERLLALLRHPRLDLQNKFKALDILEKQFSVSPEVLKREYVAVVQSAPGGWDMRQPYVAYLERIHDYKTARQVIEEWLAVHNRNEGLEEVFARTALARTYQGENRLQEGFDAVQPVIGSWQGGAMERAAILLYKLNRTEEALDLLGKVIDRYPSVSRTKAIMAEFLWRQERHADAAAALKSSQYPITPLEWKVEVGGHFAEVFANKPKEQGLAAFSALIKAGFSPGDLTLLAFPVADAKNHELAFLMTSQLHEPGFDKQIILLLYAYHHLKNWKNEQAAVDWLRPQVPLHLRGFAGAIMFQRKERELVWTLIGPTDEKAHVDFVWLMRTAVYVLDRARFKPYRAQLLDYYSSIQTKGTSYDTLGRYLLDLEPEENVLSLIKDADTLCETAYYVGLHRQTHGRYYEASDWYRISLETGFSRNGEYHWAYDQLNDWYLSGKSLKHLSDEHQAP